MHQPHVSSSDRPACAAWITCTAYTTAAAAANSTSALSQGLTPRTVNPAPRAGGKPLRFLMPGGGTTRGLNDLAGLVVLVLDDAKCATCGETTRHAPLWDHALEEHRNHAEDQDHRRPLLLANNGKPIFG
jgi:hypothetical protein